MPAKSAVGHHTRRNRSRATLVPSPDQAGREAQVTCSAGIRPFVLDMTVLDMSLTATAPKTLGQVASADVLGACIRIRGWREFTLSADDLRVGTAC